MKNKKKEKNESKKNNEENYRITKEQKRSLVFFTRTNDHEETEFVLMNKWYFLETEELRQMASYIIKFALEGTFAEEVGCCVYKTKLTEDEVSSVLIEKGATRSDDFKRKVGNKIYYF